MGAGGAALRGPQHAGADDLKDPDFVRIGNGQHLAAIAVAILLSQIAHDLHHLAGGGTTLQAQHLQVGDHEHAFGIVHVVNTRPGVLADQDALFIHEGVGHVEVGIGFSNLRNLTELLGGDHGILARIPIDIYHFAFGVGAAGNHNDPMIVPTIAAMGNHGGTISRGFLTNCNDRASQGSGGAAQNYQDGNERNAPKTNTFHLTVSFNFLYGITKSTRNVRYAFGLSLLSKLCPILSER